MYKTTTTNQDTPSFENINNIDFNSLDKLLKISQMKEEFLEYNTNNLNLIHELITIYQKVRY